jgi:hypothetical protein
VIEELLADGFTLWSPTDVGIDGGLDDNGWLAMRFRPLQPGESASRVEPERRMKGDSE